MPKQKKTQDKTKHISQVLMEIFLIGSEPGQRNLKEQHSKPNYSSHGHEYSDDQMLWIVNYWWT